MAAGDGEQRADDVVFGVLPLFHIFGLNVVLGLSLYAGAAVLLIERFDPVSALEAIEKHGVTVVLGPPTMWAAWAGLPGRGARRPVVGAPGDVRRRQAARRGRPGRRGRFGVHLGEGYGLTEASPVVTSRHGHRTRRSARSASRCPASSCAWSTPTATTCWSATPARSGCEAPTCSRATGTTPRPPPPRSPTTAGCAPATSPWSTTTATCSWSTGPRTSSSCRASTSTRPRSRRCCSSTRRSTRCAVVGVPHPYTGEAVKAYVVVAPRDPGRGGRRHRVLRRAPGPLQVPEKVMFVDELPHGLTGKVLRRELKLTPACHAAVGLCEPLHERTTVGSMPSSRRRDPRSHRRPAAGVPAEPAAAAAEGRPRSPRSGWPRWPASTPPRCARTCPTSVPTAPAASATTSSTCSFQMSRELGLTHDWPVVIVGVGNLGPPSPTTAGFTERGFPVVALVDADRAKVGQQLGDVVGPPRRRPAGAGRGALGRHRHHRHPGRGRAGRRRPARRQPASGRS